MAKHKKPERTFLAQKFWSAPFSTQLHCWAEVVLLLFREFCGNLTTVAPKKQKPATFFWKWFKGLSIFLPRNTVSLAKGLAVVPWQIVYRYSVQHHIVVWHFVSSHFKFDKFIYSHFIWHNCVCSKSDNTLFSSGHFANSHLLKRHFVFNYFVKNNSI